MKNQSLEGLRGIAAIAVGLSHLALTFWPATHTSEPWATPVPWQVHLFNSPLTFLYSGTFSVCIFFVMSGYVLSAKFWRTDDRSVILDLFSRRYFRLMPPVLVSLLLGYLLLKLHVIQLEHLGTPPWISWTYTQTPSFIQALMDGLWRAFFVDGVQTYSPVVWTMKIEFLGSILTFAFCIATKRIPFRIVAYLAAALCCIKFLNGGVYYTLFLAGIWLADARPVKIGIVPTTLFLALSLWLGGYYAGSVSYAPLDSMRLVVFGTPVETYQASCALAGFIAVFVTLSSSHVARALSRVKELGRRSFSLYLIRFPIIASAGLFTFFVTQGHSANYNAAAVLASLVSIAVAYMASGVFATRGRTLDQGLSRGRSVDRMQAAPEARQSINRACLDGLQ